MKSASLAGLSVGLAVMGWAILRRIRRRIIVKPLIRLPASSSAEGIASVLRSHGVVVIENLVPAATMDQLASDLATAGGTFHGGVNSFAGHHTLRNAAKPLGESLVAQELAVHPLVVAAVEATLRPFCKKVCLGTCSAITVEPPPTIHEPPAPAQRLHRDENMWGAALWKWLPRAPAKGRPVLSVSVMWAVSDFTESNGATRFLPGSHEWPRGAEVYGVGAVLPAGIEDGHHSVQATMAKGSVVLWSGGTLHGASSHAPRTTDDAGTDGSSVRRGLLFIYNLGYLKAEHNFHWAIPHHLMRSFSPKLADLIGLTGENAVDHPWYVGPVYTQPYLGPPLGSFSGDGVQF